MSTFGMLPILFGWMPGHMEILLIAGVALLLFGHRLGSEVAKRADVYATALFHAMTVEGMADLDLAYTPPLGSPWDAVQMAAQAWSREHRPTSIDPLPSAPSPTQTAAKIEEKTP